MLPGVNVKLFYGIKRPEVTNLAERETAILGIKQEKMNKTGNVRSSVTIRGVPVIIVAVNKVELLHILSVYM
jgi:hypothetical protein